MSSRTFTPPSYDETVHLLFDKHTGEVLANERRWSLTSGNSLADLSARSELFKGVAYSLRKQEDDLDVLVLRGSKEVQTHIKRIDVHLRKPIFDESSGVAADGVRPLRIDGP